jgi:hypothetical protein
MNTLSTLLVSWRTNCEIGWTCTWIYVPNFPINKFLHRKTFLMTKPSPSGKVKPIIVQMHSCKQWTLGIQGICFGRFYGSCKEKLNTSNKNVVEFRIINYLFSAHNFPSMSLCLHFAHFDIVICKINLILYLSNFLILFSGMHSFWACGEIGSWIWDFGMMNYFTLENRESWGSQLWTLWDCL